MKDVSDMDWRELGKELVAIYHRNDKVNKLNKSIITSCFDNQRMFTAKYKADGRIPTRGPVEAEFELIVALTARVVCLVNLDVKKGELCIIY